MDVHRLPLLGHDLPPSDPAPRAKARIFKEGSHWTWEHRCQRGPQVGYHHLTHARALRGALRHLSGCR